ncbi:meiotic nuclear division protein 1, partial [Nadsonia fulvescens var. elongata DSM 6958]
RKGQSLSQKRQTLLSYFQNSRQFFTIKEVETTVSKATSIASMQIKDILQSLIDDNLVTCEKIGAGNYYWAFLSDDVANRQKRLDSLKKTIVDNELELQNLEDKITFEQEKRREFHDPSNDNSSRLDLIQRVDIKSSHLEGIKSQISVAYKVSSNYYGELVNYNSSLRNAISVQTDNIFIIIDYLINVTGKTSNERSSICMELGIPEDLDDCPDT